MERGYQAPRGKAPMELEADAGCRGVECVVVAGAEDRLLFEIELVALVGEEFQGAREVVLADQKVEVSGFAESEIAVEGDGEQGAFEGNEGDVFGFEEADEAEKLGGEEQVIAGVGGEEGGELVLGGFGDDIPAGGAEVVIGEGADAVVGGEAEEGGPVDGAGGELGDAGCRGGGQAAARGGEEEFERGGHASVSAASVSRRCTIQEQARDSTILPCVIRMTLANMAVE
jgi:hypothetical protein